MAPPWFSANLAKLAAMGIRTPHAILLHGQSGIGKRALGRGLARALLCESGDEGRRAVGGCGQCAACLWFDQGSHPDFRSVTSEALAIADGVEPDDAADVGDAEAGAPRSKRAPSKEIKVDQIRALHALLSVATHRGGFRVVLLNPLEAVNDVAANALLKMLEEPPSRTVFILIADHLGRVASTIVSRCHKVFLATPPKTVAIDWLTQRLVSEPEALLALSGGAPLAAVALANDAQAMASHRTLVRFLAQPGIEAALATAEAFARDAPAPLIRWMQQWVADCIEMRLAGGIRYHPAQSKVIEQLVALARIDELLKLMQGLNAIRRTVEHPLNVRLMLEGLLMSYCDAIVPAPAPATA